MPSHPLLLTRHGHLRSQARSCHAKIWHDCCDDYHTPFEGGLCENSNIISVTKVTQMHAAWKSMGRVASEKRHWGSRDSGFTLVLQRNRSQPSEMPIQHLLPDNFALLFVCLLLNQNKPRRTRWAEMLAKNMPEGQILLKSLLMVSHWSLSKP